MGQLRRYFESARPCAPAQRQVGLEVETLFVDEDGAPLMPADLTRIWEALERDGWARVKDEKAMGRELRRAGFAVKPEVGAGNLELISPPRRVRELDGLLDELMEQLQAIYAAGREVGARPVFAAHDGSAQVDNIVLDNERDRQWAAIDGRGALCRLGHIASVHVTVDLSSIEEGFGWIRRLEALASERAWPPEAVRREWASYLGASRCGYAPGRFGAAPGTFDEYLELVEGFRLVVDRLADGRIVKVRDPKALSEASGEVDLETFLGTVWLHNRLRRLGEQLALEVRFIPRSSDEGLRRDVMDVVGCMSGMST